MPDPITTAADFIHLLQNQVRHHLGSHRLSLTHYAALVRADNATSADVAAQVGVTQQAISRTVRDLHLLGYLTGEPGQDRRQKRLHLTDRGREVLRMGEQLDLPPALLTAMESYVAAAGR